jgi:hypothetical protein
MAHDILRADETRLLDDLVGAASSRDKNSLLLKKSRLEGAPTKLTEVKISTVHGIRSLFKSVSRFPYWLAFLCLFHFSL